ncbi:MAG: hypothetical protein K2L54_00400 [Clostridiales bacterium]|nr:hypothetical protein [Clostridiales bacterium]
MELHIQSDFECVYSINGEFYERAESLTMSEYDVVYVTVFPLKHTLLPYTVKLNGAENIKTELAYGLRLSPEHYLLTLSPRYVIVYGNASAITPPQSSRIARLFSLIKSGDVGAAYAMLSAELRGEIDKNTLVDFFSEYERIAECNWESGGKFYLIDKNGAARLHAYSLKDEFIDDISECD